VNNASGWTDKGVGDLHDIHHYPDPRAPQAEEKRAIVLGEFGGLGLPIKDHTWQIDKNWGYENMDDPSTLLEKYEQFYSEVYKLVESPGLSAVIYTQTTDVEIETNGLMTYDRHLVKMGASNIRKANAGYFGPDLKNHFRSFISGYSVDFCCQKEDALIHYSIDGSTPDRESPLFSEPFSINESTVIKAIAYWKNGESSRVSEFNIEKVVPKPSVRVTPHPGLKYRFFTGAWEQLPDFKDLTPQRNGITGKFNLNAAKGLTQDFALLFSGYLNVPATAVYSLQVSSDDGCRIILDGEQVLDYDGIHGMGDKSIDLALELGFHSI